MKRSVQLIAILLAVSVIAIIAIGCATTINVKEDMTFASRQGTIAKTVALYIPQESKQFKRTGGHSGGECTIEYGKSIAPNAERSLSMIFTKVEVIGNIDPQTLGATHADYMIELKFNDDTSVQVGAMTFSAHKVTVSLKCVATQSRDRAVVFQEDVKVEKEKRSAVGFIPGPWATMGWESALQSASDEAVQEALEKINELILANREKFR